MSGILELSLLGRLELRRNGVPVADIQAGKTLALLSYLVVTARPHTRPALAGLLWGGMPEAKARGNLSKALSSLRHVVGDHLTIARQMVAFEPDGDFWLDVAEFEAGVSDNSIERLQAAVELYQGDFLDGFYVRNAPEFEDWALAQQARLKELALRALHTLAAHFAEQGEVGWATAIDYTNRLLRLEPWREEAHRQMMRLLALNGQRSAALGQYKTCQQALAEELGVEPGPETTILYEKIRDGELSRGGSEPSLQPETSRLPTLDLPDFLQTSETPSTADWFPFVAREPELAQLNRWLKQAQAGQGRVAFVIGEPGSGKTALVGEFMRWALIREADLVVAGGNCNAYGGMGDPYLPFREILNQLTGDVEARWRAGVISREHARRLWSLIPQSVQALVTIGPDLLDIFIPASTLRQRATRVAPNGAPWLDQLGSLLAQREAGKSQVNLEQTDLFEAYTKVLQTLAQQQPLILILDDLQWADAGSISLLFHLGRRLAGRRILVVGIYRPNDVALGRDGERHPLESVVNEFQGLFGDMPLDLGQIEGKHFVDSILDVERNRLSPAFREKLFQHTRGHPLFTIEILRGLQARGDLVQDEAGAWVEGPAINWAQLPTRVEGVIGERIGRLPATLQEIMKVASVMGEEFVAEVVARVLELDEREVIRQLSRVLDKQHHLVQSQGGQRLEGQRVSQYRFRHILFQYYLYYSIDEVERVYLHDDVGSELEQLYQGQTEVVTVQLARHFREAGLTAKALGYLQQAGKQAMHSFAYHEAIRFFRDAITLLETLPVTPERRQQELKLQLALAGAQRKAGQIMAALDTFQLSAGIAGELGRPEDLARSALGYEELRWRYNLPAELATHLLEGALSALGEEDSPPRVRLLVSLSRAMFTPTGSLEQRAAMAQQAVGMARRINDALVLYEALHNSVLANRQPERIEERIAVLNEMLELAEQIRDVEKVLDTTMLRIYDQLELWDIQSVKVDLEAYTRMAEETRQPFFVHNIGVMQTGLLLLAGRFEEAERLAQEALDIAQRMGVENADGVFGMQMFTIRREQGRLQELVPIIKHFVTHHSAAATWRPGLALIYSDLGFEQEARTEFEYLAANDFADLPQDALWLTCIVYLSEVCAFLGDADRAAVLYQHLLPYAGHNVVVGLVVACYGAVSRYLGLLATTMSCWEAAERHFEEALKLNAGMEAKPWLAHTQYQYAAMLLARGQAGDGDQAMSLLDEALVTAHELGMKSLIEKAEALNQATMTLMKQPNN
ncbi:MAG: BTAD domain-containing putative transcriptional regulator [Anaerolineae bacterium]